jgi:hypothetical protein
MHGRQAVSAFRPQDDAHYLREGSEEEGQDMMQEGEASRCTLDEAVV